MTALAKDVERIAWAAEQLGIGESTAYRLAETGTLPGAFRVGRQWRISIPRFRREVHGELEDLDPSVEDAHLEEKPRGSRCCKVMTVVRDRSRANPNPLHGTPDRRRR